MNKLLAALREHKPTCTHCGREVTKLFYDKDINGEDVLFCNNLCWDAYHRDIQGYLKMPVRLVQPEVDKKALRSNWNIVERVVNGKVKTKELR